MRKRKMYLSVEDIAELFGLSVSFAYRVLERMNADLESKNYYVKTAWRRPPVGRHAINCWE